VSPPGGLGRIAEFMDNRAVPPTCPCRSGLAAIAVALVTSGAGSAIAGEPPTEATVATTARASFGAAAARMLAGTQEIAMFALSLVGIDYRYGGDTPERGLDCSGLIHYVFQEVTGVTLPRTARELSRIGERIAPRDLRPGDLVFFNTRHYAYSHVGIYLGENRFIHAPSKGREVGVASLSQRYWQQRFDGARRLVGVIPQLMPDVVSPAAASTPGSDIGDNATVLSGTAVTPAGTGADPFSANQPAAIQPATSGP